MQRTFGIGQWAFCLWLGLACSFTIVEALLAQDFPTKPINMVIPYGAGGASDLTARAFISTAKQHLGQPIVIQIRAGGSGAIGSESVAQAKPDGYTLLLGHTNCNTVLPAVQKRRQGAGRPGDGGHGGHLGQRLLGPVQFPLQNDRGRHRLGQGQSRQVGFRLCGRLGRDGLRLALAGEESRLHLPKHAVPGRRGGPGAFWADASRSPG